MKLLLCVLGAVFMLAGCDSASDSGEQTAPKGVGTSVKEAVNDTADYVTGAKQVKVKKVSTQRINNLNQKHNDDVDKALED